MKIHSLFVLVSIFAISAGCSSMVAVSGKDVSTLASADQVHKEFGKPTATGVADDREYEEYKTHCKIADPQRAGILVMGDLMTSGLMEVFLFPYEMACLGHTAIMGDTLRVCYDSQHNVTDVYLDGDQISMRSNATKTIEGQK
jgi:hypothetical protein